MKQIFIILIFTFVLIFTNILAQNINIKEGGYKDIGDFKKSKTLIQNQQFIVKPTIQKDIYDISVKGSRKLTRKTHSKTTLIYQDSVLYINLNKMKKGCGFAKTLELGRFSIFRGPINLRGVVGESNDRIMKHLWIVPKIRTIYNLITAPKRIKKNLKKKIETALFYYDLKSGNPKDLSIYNMHIALKYNRILHKKYKKEENKDSTNLKVNYLKELNSTIPLY